jgi:hypothetical protein
MPTTAKTSSKPASLGDLSTYSVSTSAIPHDTSDSSGAIPTVSATFADGIETDYLLGESLTLENAAIGKYTGEIIGLSSSTNSGRYTISSETILSRLNSEQRVYPSQTYGSSTALPLAALEYWSQECGIFYDAVEGDVLFYQSQYLHWFAFAKGINRPIRGTNASAAGGEEITVATLGARYVTTFGKNRDLAVQFPEGYSLPVQIPAVPDPSLVVFSSGVLNQGNGRQATITWTFETPTKAKVYLKAIIDNAAGITLQTRDSGTAYTTAGTVAAAVNGNYRLNVGVTSFSSTQTTFKLSVLDSASAVVGSTSTNLTSALKGNLSLTSVVYRGEDQGSEEAMMHWGDSISIMPAMPTTRPASLKSLSPGPKEATAFTGFSGNVWERIKAYCSIYHLDVSYEEGKFHVEARQTETTPVTTLGTLSKKLDKRDQARFVEVVCLNSKPTSGGGFTVPLVMWKADSVYQVAVGATEEFLVQTEHSILALSQPVAVTGIEPYPYKAGAGQYVVTGSDGYIVSPAFWRDQGGKITVETTENEGEIKVTIKGPDFDSVRAPYRISEGDAGRPALYITGEGIINTPKTLRVSTGNTKAAKEVGVTLESPFLGDITLAYDAAVRAAEKFSSPDLTVGIIEALDYDKPSDLGTAPAGQLIKRDGNILRVTDATQNPATLTGNTSQHNTLYQVHKSFGDTATVGEVNVYYAGKTIGQANLKPLKVVK